jgi:hypothetical protein
LGRQLCGLLSVLNRFKCDERFKNIGIWGDSFAALNDKALDEKPLRTHSPWAVIEPLGAELAILAALFDSQIKAVYARKGLASRESIFSTWQCCLPHDAVVPNVVAAGDFDDLVRVLCPLPLRLEMFLDGQNRRLEQAELECRFKRTLREYAKAELPSPLAADPVETPARWFPKYFKNMP